MEVVAAGAAWLLGDSPASAWFSGVQSQFPFLAPSTPLVQVPDLLNITADLAPFLSPQAAVHLPTEPSFDALSIRVPGPRIAPQFAAAVEAATERDVQLTIDFANRHGVPFLAVSGAHGFDKRLRGADGGIQINMRKLNSIELARDGKSVTAGGGIIGHELTSTLFEQGKQGVTGICECVSVISPIMGGGHGLLQGRHGLAADNLISARLVTANASVFDVSATSHPDLFWALRGAGHNFGIVTSFQYKAHDIPAGNQWSCTRFMFTQDKLEDVFAVVNKLTDADGSHPVELIEWGHFVRDPEIDAERPLIVYDVFYEGTPEDARPFVDPFYALGPAKSEAKMTGYNGLSAFAGFDLASPPCRKGANMAVWPVSLMRYNATAMRETFGAFEELTAQPEFAHSIFLLESYGTRGVKAVEEKGTAVAREERQSNILLSPVLVWLTTEDPQVEQRAQTAGTKMKDTVNAGRTPQDGPAHSYINYAGGTETLEEIYGRDEWRLEKLRSLKEEWDPERKFNFYAPLS